MADRVPIIGGPGAGAGMEVGPRGSLTPGVETETAVVELRH